MSQAMMSVSSLNTKIKSLLEATFMHILVEGEVASVTYHTSGHVYFSIKDNESSIKCVMWKSNVAKLKFRIEQGMHIVVEGSIGVYTPRGEYQFYVVKIEPYGKGALALAYEQLKEKLKDKGYFDPLHKKQIPKIPQKIALVTAKESAALQDMLKIIQKRWPLVEVIVVDTLVQGEQAAGRIVKALHYADKLGVDVVVTGRGGGSAEDLWAFNEEIVADAIFSMNTPVVSAVGHEVDVMISDFVADLRAPTPSAAMEMILPDFQEMLYVLNEQLNRIGYLIQQVLHRKEKLLEHLHELLYRASPLRQLNEKSKAFKQLETEFERIIKYKVRDKVSVIPDMRHSFAQAIGFIFHQKKSLLDTVNQKMEMNDPKKQYKKGWAQVSVNGHTASLEALEVKETFILEDQTCRIEAVCLQKSMIRTSK